jgi:hypothetical protein
MQKFRLWDETAAVRDESALRVNAKNWLGLTCLSEGHSGSLVRQQMGAPADEITVWICTRSEVATVVPGFQPG